MDMRKRWFLLWERLRAQGDAGAAFRDIVTRYSEPHRRYHTLAHIEHCLLELDAVEHFLVRRNSVELALWLHDFIYDTRAKDNENQSALGARNLALAAGLEAYFADGVEEFILATKHSSVPEDYDCRFLIDIDLAILGQPKERFDEYERQIREEYGWVPDADFAKGRAAILRQFLNRPSIYSMGFFQRKYEAQARQNLARSIARLSSSS